MPDGLEQVRSCEAAALQPPKLDAAELREVLRTRNDIPLRDFVMTIVLVFVPPLAMYLWPSVWVGIVCAFVNIHTFNRCGQLVHHSDHSALFSNKRLEAIVGQIAGFFVGYLQEGHKETHNEHHLYLNSDRDPDRMWCEPEARVSSVVRGWLRDLFLISAAVRFLQYIPGTRGKARRQDQPPLTAEKLFTLGVSFVPVATVQLAVLLAYTAAAGFGVLRGMEYYLLIYILPLFVLYPLQIRLRSNVEHSYLPGYQCRGPEDVGVVRSIRPNWLERLIVAPLNYDCHFEHHLYPTMPYYNAATLRRLFDAKGFAIPMAPGYVRFIWRKWQAERALDHRAHAA